MIQLTRLNGDDLGINADLIEKVESNPDTVLTLVGGSKYLVAETTEQVIHRIVEFRAQIIREAREDRAPVRVAPSTLRVVDPPATHPAKPAPQVADEEEERSWIQ